MDGDSLPIFPFSVSNTVETIYNPADWNLSFEFKKKKKQNLALMPLQSCIDAVPFNESFAQHARFLHQLYL